jgi:hypothetical protein
MPEDNPDYYPVDNTRGQHQMATKMKTQVITSNNNTDENLDDNTFDNRCQ